MNTNILFLGGKYFGKADASGVCCKNLFNECKKQKIDAYVLGYSNEDYRFGDGDKEISFYFEKDKKNLKYFNSLTRCFKPNIDYKLVNTYFEHACHVIEDKNINVVVGIFFPFETIEVLKRIKEKYNEILVINYEVDSATDNLIYTSRLGKFHVSAIKRYLNHSYKYIDYVFVMKSHYQHILESYDINNKTVKIEAPFLLEEIKSNKQNKDTIDFLYVGFLDKDNYSPEPILQLFKNNKDKSNWRMHFISRGNCEEWLEKESKADSRIIRHGYVEFEEVKNYLSSADFLISIEYKQKPSSIPAKVFNYFSTGKPIIHFCSGEYRYFIDNYISKYDLGFYVSKEDKTSNKDINEFITSKHDKLVNYDLIISTFIMNTPRYSVDKILECIKDK